METSEFSVQCVDGQTVLALVPQLRDGYTGVYVLYHDYETPPLVRCSTSSARRRANLNGPCGWDDEVVVDR